MATPPAELNRSFLLNLNDLKFKTGQDFAHLDHEFEIVGRQQCNSVCDAFTCSFTSTSLVAHSTISFHTTPHFRECLWHAQRTIVNLTIAVISSLGVVLESSGLWLYIHIASWMIFICWTLGESSIRYTYYRAGCVWHISDTGGCKKGNIINHPWTCLPIWCIPVQK